MFAKLNRKGQVTVPKEIRDRIGLQAGSKLELQLLPDDTISVRLVQADAMRLRGLLKSPHSKPLTIEQMDQGIERYVREKFPRVRSAPKRLPSKAPLIRSK